MQYGCIGEHLTHSFSKEIHALFADYSYELCELAPTEIAGFLTKREFCGINVTIPYKETVIPFLDEIDEQARAIGAVNTIVNRQGRLCGYNTDFYGMSALIRRIGVEIKGKKVAVLGTGGTSRTACAVARAMGACEVLRVSRSARDGAIDYQTLYEQHADVRFLINTTPCGMYPRIRGAAVELTKLPCVEGIADAVYNPLRPQLVLDAQARGIPAEGGLFMLVAQAIRASEIFLDVRYPAEVLERVFRTVLASKENIVLIGMPGCGKTTVGGLLAKRLNRPLLDLDACIVEAAGKPIPEIFAQSGESGFRDLESRVLAEELAHRNGAVIATGGGAILRDENIRELKRNGRLFFIDRPLRDLLPTEDRPLASTAEAIRKRYEERYDRYCAVADVRIDGGLAAEAVAETIGREMDLL